MATLRYILSQKYQRESCELRGAAQPLRRSTHRAANRASDHSIAVIGIGNTPMAILLHTGPVSLSKSRELNQSYYDSTHEILEERLSLVQLSNLCTSMLHLLLLASYYAENLLHLFFSAQFYVPSYYITHCYKYHFIML